MSVDKSTSLNQSSRDQWIDILRGLAILGVVAVHTIQLTDELIIAQGGMTSVLFSNFVSLGRYGVELFFFLSGWLLVGIYGHHKNPLKKNYWIRRFARIYPLWAIFFCVQLVKASINSGTDTIDWATKVSDGEYPFFHSLTAVALLTLTFTLWISPSLWNSVIPGGWSIQAEIAHYLIFPLVRRYSIGSFMKILTLVNFSTFFLYLFSKATSDVSSLSIINYFINSWIRLNIYSTVCYFFFGIIGALIFSELKEGAKLIEAVKGFGLTPIGSITFLITFLAVPLNFGTQSEAIGYLTVMLFISLGIKDIKAVSRILITFGKYSYFIYFFHFQLIIAISILFNKYSFHVSWLGSQFVLFPILGFVILLISLFFATVSYKVFEGPIIRAAHRFH
jgi:peptidoglycan/LPS O-acetylase OafA/YrhL